MRKLQILLLVAVIGCTNKKAQSDTELGEIAMQKAMRTVINDSTAYIALRFNYDTVETIGDIRSTYRVTHIYSNKYNRNQTKEIQLELVKFHRNEDREPKFFITDIKPL
ncbi:hypothetical protein PK28_08575 [Hymenobacter sp. DG25B]|uniref:hypothetical protein n=1 Tax=Hymenobacter sp. DG25B TaxID=1385664 RepID=UPI000540BCE1|nr:hypothetical protein [Hymenobacter sp. DG25B]AIZ63736.1 hypothetical protein PK28_08575 [Hymenobacter sp. DG25B]